MAVLNKKVWTLKTYTNAAWTDLVAEPGIVATLIICNTGATGIAVSVRLTDSAGTELAIIVPTTTVAGNSSQGVEFPRSLSIPANVKVQVQAAAAGIHFTASGAADA